jgi:ferrochelatase
LVEYLGEWHAHPLFIEAAADRVADALARLEPLARHRAQLIFTAHSIPAAMAAASPYVEQLRESARLIADRLKRREWTLAFQSRSGSPRDPWLEPDVNATLERLAAGGARAVVVAPVGFVCDHVEVLYDLDVEARATAGRCGLAFARAVTMNDHPLFVRMLADVIQESAP